MAAGVRMTEQELSAYYDRRKTHSDTDLASAGGNVEQRIVNESKTTHEVQAFVQAVDIRFTHYRRRLSDPDNFATKHFVDGLVEVGLLRDDCPEFVNEVRHKQVKIPAWQEEWIQIEILTNPSNS